MSGKKKIGALITGCSEKYKIKQIAGFKGINRPVSWVYLSEDIGNVSFLENGELIITTGYFTLEGVGLYEFLSKLIRKNMSGVIINTGKYIFEKDISSVILNLCDENSFPLYIMPWEVQITEVMQKLCGELIKNRDLELRLWETLTDAIENPSPESIKALEKFGLDPATLYRIAIFDDENAPKSADIIIFEHKGKAAALINAESGNLSFKGVTGVSPKGSLKDLPSLYEKAVLAHKASSLLLKAPCFYENLGVLRLILKIDDSDFLREYADEKLKSFEEYDKTHGARLVETLFGYIKTGGSLADTAALMFTHRNTIGYRINKIKELGGLNPDSFEARCEYLAAIYIRKLSENNQ